MIDSSGRGAGRRGWGLTLAVLLLPGIAAAFVLQGPHALELMIARLGKAERLTVVQSVTVAEDGGERRTGQTVRYGVPDRLRIDAEDDDGPLRTRVAVGGDLSGTPAPALSYYHDLFLFRDRPDLVQRLRRRGINPALSCLGRYEGQVALVVGARRADAVVDQLWIDKETWRPLRWVDQRPAGLAAARLEVRFAEWVESGSQWYPRRILFLTDDVRRQEVTVETVRVDPVFEAGLFALPE